MNHELGGCLNSDLTMCDACTPEELLVAEDISCVIKMNHVLGGMEFRIGFVRCSPEEVEESQLEENDMMEVAFAKHSPR